MKNLQQIGGISAILEGTIYIIAFIIFGGILEFPSANATTVQKYDFLVDNYVLLYVIHLVMYVLFGVILSVLSLAIYQRLKDASPVIAQVATVFAFLWIGLVIASGMIYCIGMTTIIEIGKQDTEKAMLIWSAISIVVEGLGGGNEIVGGIWVLLLSIAAFQGKSLPKSIILLGVFVGIAGIITIFPSDDLTAIFGLSQIFWFIALGVFMVRNAEI